MNKVTLFYLVIIGRILSSLTLLFTVNACVREEVLDDIQSDYFQPQLVVHSLISPDDSIFVSVGKSISLGDTVETTKVKNATVILTDEQENTIALPLVQEDYYNAVYGISQQDFPVQAGATYRLFVTHPELPKVEAICTVPSDATPLRKVEYVGKSIIPDDDNLSYDVAVSWYDNGPYLHRVYFVSHFKEVNPQNGNVLKEGKYYQGHDPFHGIEQTDSLFVYQHNFFSGGQYFFSIDTLPDGVISYKDAISVTTTYELTTYLITPDEHMARYQASQDIFARNRDALSADSFVELYRGIIPEYSNVRGGLGVFGAYLRSEPVYLTLE